jgi:hypothetical protein
MYETEINKLFSLMGVDFSAIASTDLEPMIESMIGNLQKEFPDFSIPESFWDKYRKDPDIESLRSLYVAIYNRHYTREEIAGLIAFYESPLGRKSVQVNPQITQETQAVTQAYFESLIKETVEELIAEDEDS